MAATECTRERIALLLGIPVSADEFVARARSPQGWDYGELLSVDARDPLDAFHTSYEAQMLGLNDLVQSAALAHVDVVHGATLASFREAVASHDVVILVAHWRGSDVRRADVGIGAVSVMERLLADKESAVGQALQQVQIPQVATRLTRVIRSSALTPYLPAGLAGRVQAHEVVLMALARDMVDAAFEGHIRRGNLLELFDGLHPPMNVSAAIPDRFAGTIDLSCCHSTVLASLMRLQHGDRIVLHASNEGILPGPQMRMVESAFRVMQICPGMRYRDARIATAQEFHDAAARRRSHANHRKETT